MRRGIRGVVRVIVWMTLTLLSVNSTDAQWRPLFTRGGSFNTIYFLDLPGPPRVGFLGMDDGWYKTTDGGYSWRWVFGYAGYDITFEDSMTGWIAAYGSVLGKTTDGGNTWDTLMLPQNISNSGNLASIYYDTGNHTLFTSGPANGPADNLYATSDEGKTWFAYDRSECACSDGGGFAFVNTDSGIRAGLPFFRKTTDGGRTWADVAFDSGDFTPLAIPGTETYFVFTSGLSQYNTWATVIRTDDSWKTWKVLDTFHFSNYEDQRFGIITSCIRGTLNNLIIQDIHGCYRSTDSGVTWKALCGPA
ncbi:MAG: hypothetical protein ACRDF4_11895, partial [Rhabdochlamydiaceae bacterium]